MTRHKFRVSPDGRVVYLYPLASMAKVPSAEITPMTFFDDPLTAFLVASERRRLSRVSDWKVQVVQQTTVEDRT